MNIGLKANAQAYNFFVIDDNMAMIKILSKLLTILGGNVIEWAMSGHEALKKIEPLKDQIDCITCDVNMPGKLDGITLIPYLKNINPAFNIIMISAIADNANISQSKAAGVDYFLDKPVRREQLYNILKEVFKIP
ncbi:MAG: response regulator [Candidatus Margulisbacteria bacterium]|nr:response regulator [Candidatus Margulisiibacteriota bacterium]